MQPRFSFPGRARGFGSQVPRSLVVLLLGVSGCAKTPRLHDYVPAGEAAVARILAAGDDPRAVDAKEVTALHLAALRGDSDVVRLLINHGAETEARSTADETPLFLAAKLGSPETVYDLLVAGADPNAPCGALKYTSLHAAVFYGDVQTANVLLSAGADVNARTNAGETPLHLAARIDPARGILVADLLLVAGADINSRDLRGFMPLHTVAAADDVLLLRMLEARGADRDALTVAGDTPLDIALRYEADRTAQDLYESGAAPKTTSNAEMPILAAARMGDASRIRRILAAARRDKPPLAVARALELAVAGGHADAAALLRGRARLSSGSGVPDPRPGN